MAVTSIPVNGNKAYAVWRTQCLDNPVIKNLWWKIEEKVTKEYPSLFLKQKSRIKGHFISLLYHIEHGDVEPDTSASIFKVSSEDIISERDFCQLQLPGTFQTHFFITIQYTQDNIGDPVFEGGSGDIKFLSIKEANVILEKIRARENTTGI